MLVVGEIKWSYKQIFSQQTSCSHKIQLACIAAFLIPSFAWKQILKKYLCFINEIDAI